MLDIDKRESQDHNNFNEHQEINTENNEKKEWVASKKELTNRVHQQLLNIKENIDKKIYKEGEENIEQKLYDDLDKIIYDRDKEPEVTRKQRGKILNNINYQHKSLKGRSPEMQKEALIIEQDVLVTIENSDKDPNIIASFIGKAMKAIMKRES